MRKHLSYSNVMSTLAFFMAVIGGGVAVASVPNNSVTSKKIVDETVQAKDIRNGAVKMEEIGIQAVGSEEIALFSVATEDIGLEAVTAVSIKDGAVRSEEIANDEVDAAEIGDGIHNHASVGTPVDGAAAENGSYVTGTAVATCEGGEELISGAATWGGAAANEELVISQINLDHTAESVTVIGGNDSGTTRTLFAVAVCLHV